MVCVLLIIKVVVAVTIMLCSMLCSMLYNVITSGLIVVCPKQNKQTIKKPLLNFAYMFTALRFKCRYFSKVLNLKICKVNFTEFFNIKAIHFFEVAHSKWWNL